MPPGMPPAPGGGFPGLPGMPGMPGVPDYEEDEVSTTDDGEPPPKPQKPQQEHFEDTIVVRDVDKDTDARGIRRMTEGDFTRMWCDIDGYRKAQLFRDDGNRDTKYGGSYGIVTFASEAAAADAMAQTFGCGLNVSFYGVAEMLELYVTQQQLWCQNTGGYNDHEARMSG